GESERGTISAPNYEYATTKLGNSVVCGQEHLPLWVVPKLRQGTEQALEMGAMSLVRQRLNILQNERLGLGLSDHSHVLLKQRGVRVSRLSLLCQPESRLRKRSTWRSANNQSGLSLANRCSI